MEYVKTNNMDSQRNRRIIALGTVFLLCFTMVIVRLYSVQFGSTASSLIEIRDNIFSQTVNLTPGRGIIYDRWGNALADNHLIYEVAVDLKYVINPTTIALVTSVELELDYYDVFSLVHQNPSDAPFSHITLNYFVPYQKAQKLLDIKEQLAFDPRSAGISADGRIHSLDGLLITPRLTRYYPEDTLASNVLGFVNLEYKAYYGVEEYYKDLLVGTSKQVTIDYGQPTPEIERAPNVILTIDKDIQSSAQLIINKVTETTSAERGVFIVVDPVIGEILAMGSTNQFNPNSYQNFEEKYSQSEVFNPAISYTYDPGWIMLPIKLAIEMDIENKYLQATDSDKTDFDEEALACLSKQDMCKGLAANHFRDEEYYSYLELLGFGSATGIDLAQEAEGNLNFLHDHDQSTAGIFDSIIIEASPLQIAMAFSSIVNNGQVVQPKVVYSLDSENQYHLMSDNIVGKFIQEKTAVSINELLEINFSEYYPEAMVPTYDIAGFGDIFESNLMTGDSLPQSHTSFVGWGPTNDIQFLVFVYLENPNIDQSKENYAAIAFKEIALSLVNIMNIPTK